MHPACSLHQSARRQRYLLPAALLGISAILACGCNQALAQYPAQPSPQQDYGQYAPDEDPNYNQPDYGSQNPTQPQYPGQNYPGPNGVGPNEQDPNDQGQYSGPAPVQTQAPLNTEQLEQLVAPIALYPDNLVAQVLAAATYPAQVVDADHWRQSIGNAPPEQVVGQANTQSWDPSIKALTAMPQLLTQMDQNIRWTVALGNAYYNQPQDVLDVIQVMRQRAQQAGNLQSGPQETVNYDQGYIQVAPANPELVYLPVYNPWTAYGAPIAPYRGFSLVGALGSFFNAGYGNSAVRYGLSFAMSAFSQTPWGWLGWGLDWLGHSLLYHNSGYYSHSTTLADWGLPRGGPRARYYHGVMHAGLSHGYERGGYEHGSYDHGGYNRNYGFNTARDQARGQFYNRQGNDYRQRYDDSYNRPYNHSGMQGYNRGPEGIARPQQYGSNSFQPRNFQSHNEVRPQVRGGGSAGPAYGSGFYNRGAMNPNANRGFEGRSGGNGGMQTYRTPSPAYGHENFGNRGFGGYSGKPEKSGGSHWFGRGGGGGYKAPKAPKMDHGGGFGGGHHNSHGGGGGHSGGGHGGHHH